MKLSTDPKATCLYGLPGCECKADVAKIIKEDEDAEKYKQALIDAYLAFTPKETEEDDVERPSHYNTGAVECIEGLEACLSAEEYQGYLRGNAMKYLWRCSYKGSMVKDLKKATWYIERLVEKLGG